MKPAHLILAVLGAIGWCLIGLALVPDPLVGAVAGLFGAYAGCSSGATLSTRAARGPGKPHLHWRHYGRRRKAKPDPGHDPANPHRRWPNAETSR